jgi:octaprenyl-diphosphate synthase
MSKLDNILKQVGNDLDRFDTIFKKQLQSNVPLLNMVLRYVASRSGKKIRPALIFLTSSLFGDISQRAYIGASMTELLHTATLVHDDVVDEANERRGFLSINAIWKNKVSVLLGDYLLSRGLLVAVENNEYKFLQVTSHAVQKMSEGELQSMEASRRLSYDEQTYFKIITNKTAVLLRSCCEIGAISQDQPDSIVEAMGNFGELIGIAFQIKDDIFDYTNSSSLLGKPVGNDIREKKITLPLIIAFKNSTQTEIDQILKKIKNTKTIKKEVPYIIDYVKERNGIIESEKIASGYVNQAQHILNQFKESRAKNCLMDFSLYVIEREK